MRLVRLASAVLPATAPPAAAAPRAMNVRRSMEVMPRVSARGRGRPIPQRGEARNPSTVQADRGMLRRCRSRRRSSVTSSWPRSPRSWRMRAAAGAGSGSSKVRRGWASRGCWTTRHSWRATTAWACCGRAATSWSARSVGASRGRCWRPRGSTTERPVRPGRTGARRLHPRARTPRARGFAILHALYWLTVRLAERAPLLLVVDDAHWADEPSLRFLVYLAGRLADQPIAVLVGDARRRAWRGRPARAARRRSGGPGPSAGAARRGRGGRAGPGAPAGRRPTGSACAASSSRPATRCRSASCCWRSSTSRRRTTRRHWHRRPSWRRARSAARYCGG